MRKRDERDERNTEEKVMGERWAVRQQRKEVE